MEGGFATLPRSAMTVSRNRYRIPRVCTEQREPARKISATLGSRGEMENVGGQREREKEGRPCASKVGGRSCEKINSRGKGRSVSGMQSAVRYTCTITAILHIVWVRWCHLPAISGVTYVSHLLRSRHRYPLHWPTLNEFRSFSLEEKARERARAREKIQSKPA